MSSNEMRSRIERVMILTKKLINRYGNDKINNIGISHSNDIDAFYTSLMVCIVAPDRFLDGLGVFFVYAYMCGQDSMAVQQSDELKAAKKRLNYLAVSGAIGVYDADQLIADVKVVMEALK